MYSQTIIDRNIASVTDSTRRDGDSSFSLVHFDVDTCLQWVEALKYADPDKSSDPRHPASLQLYNTPEAQAFIRNERILCRLD